MKAKNDFKFIHIGWSEDICCKVNKGRVINRINKSTYTYCYNCNKTEEEK